MRLPRAMKVTVLNFRAAEEFATTKSKRLPAWFLKEKGGDVMKAHMVHAAKEVLVEEKGQGKTGVDYAKKIVSAVLDKMVDRADEVAKFRLKEDEIRSLCETTRSKTQKRKTDMGNIDGDDAPEIKRPRLNRPRGDRFDKPQHDKADGQRGGGGRQNNVNNRAALKHYEKGHNVDLKKWFNAVREECGNNTAETNKVLRGVACPHPKCWKLNEGKCRMGHNENERCRPIPNSMRQMKDLIQNLRRR